MNIEYSSQAPLAGGDRRGSARGQAAPLLFALSATLAGCQSEAAREPTDTQLVAIVRQYAARLPHPVDPVEGRAVRVERTPREWVVTLIDPRRLDPLGRRYLAGECSAYHIDRATLRVVSVVVTEQAYGPG